MITNGLTTEINHYLIWPLINLVTNFLTLATEFSVSKEIFLKVRQNATICHTHSMTKCIGNQTTRYNHPQYTSQYSHKQKCKSNNTKWTDRKG